MDTVGLTELPKGDTLFGLVSLAVIPGSGVQLDWPMWALGLICGLGCLGLTWLVAKPVSSQEWLSCTLISAILGFAMVASYQQDHNWWMSVGLGPALAVFYGFMRAIREVGINPLD